VAEAGQEIDILLAGAGEIQYGKTHLTLQIEEELFEAAALTCSDGVFAGRLQKRKIGSRIRLSPRRHRGFAAFMEDGAKFFL